MNKEQNKRPFQRILSVALAGLLTVGMMIPAVAATPYRPEVAAQQTQAQAGTGETVLPDLSGLEQPQSIARSSGSGGLRPLNVQGPINGHPGQFEIEPGADFLPLVGSRSSRGIQRSTLLGSGASVGATAEFICLDDLNATYNRTATLAAVGSHCRVWVDRGDDTNDYFFGTAAQEIAREFDAEIWPLLTNNFGTPQYIQGTAQTINLILYDIDQDGGNRFYSAGYFFTGDYTNDKRNHDSILYIDIGAGQGADTYKSGTAGKVSFMGTIAHELQHLINFSEWLENMNNSQLEVDPSDPEYGSAVSSGSTTFVTTWYNEGLSGLVDVLYAGKKGYSMEDSHLKYLLTGDFANGVGYVPTSDQWDSTNSSNSILANYGSSSALMQEYYAVTKDAKNLVANSRVGYLGAMRNIGEGFGGDASVEAFDRFFTAASLNIHVDTDGDVGTNQKYSSALPGNVWSQKMSYGAGLQAFHPNQACNVNSGGRAYFNQVYLAPSIGANNTAYITVPSGAEYYVITPYNQVGVNSASAWANASKIAGKLNPGENKVTVGSDNMFAVLVINHSSPVSEDMSYRLENLNELVSIDAFPAITGVPYATEKTAVALGLSTHAKVTVDVAGVTEVNDYPVTWDVDGCSYIPTNTSAQTFDVHGEVVLPEAISIPPTKNRNVVVSVSVNAAQPGDPKALTSISGLSAISGLASGTVKSVEDLTLPTTVGAETNMGSVQLPINWDLDSASYNPQSTVAQTFTVSGEAALPSDVINPNGVSLAVSVEVSVNAKETTPNPIGPFNPYPNWPTYNPGNNSSNSYPSFSGGTFGTGSVAGGGSSRGSSSSGSATGANGGPGANSRDTDIVRNRANTTTTTTATATEPTNWMEGDKLAAALASVKAQGANSLLTTSTNKVGIKQADLQKLDIALTHDTMANGKVQVRITLPNPSAATGDLLLSAYTQGPAVEKLKSLFEKWFTNDFAVIRQDQREDWGQPIQIAAKVDMTGIDLANAVFLSYDSSKNTYRRIAQPNPRLDSNGYLHLTTTFGGDIIISEGVPTNR